MLLTIYVLLFDGESDNLFLYWEKVIYSVIKFSLHCTNTALCVYNTVLIQCNVYNSTRTLFVPVYMRFILNKRINNIDMRKHIEWDCRSESYHYQRSLAGVSVGMQGAGGSVEINSEIELHFQHTLWMYLYTRKNVRMDASWNDEQTCISFK